MVTSKYPIVCQGFTIRGASTEHKKALLSINQNSTTTFPDNLLGS